MSFWQGRIQEDDLHAAWQELAAQAKDKPWLLKLLAERGAALATRYAVWKGRLGRMRQGERRRLQRRLGVGLAGAALLLALAASPGLGAPAAGMMVTNGSSTIADADGCSLPEAIINANYDDQSGSTDCPTGSGNDTITLATSVVLTAALDTTYGNTGLPAITSPITIEGAGNTISRSSSASVDFRIMAVGAYGDLTLNSATISGGVATAPSATVASGVSAASFGDYAYGGGVYVGEYLTTALAVSTQSGAVDPTPSATITHSTISGNQADYGGGVYAGGAVLSIANSTISGNWANVAGGGIYVWDGATATVYDSTVSANTAVLSGGGAQAGYYSGLFLYGAVVSGNSAYAGAGILNTKSSLGVIYSTIEDNSFYASALQASSTTGASAAARRGAPTFQAAQELRASRASGDMQARRHRQTGAAAQAAPQDAAAPTYYYYFAPTGGGIYNASGVAYIVASTVSGNTMPLAGGLGNVRGTMVVGFSTVSDNTSLPQLNALQSSGAAPERQHAIYGIGGGIGQYVGEAILFNSTLTGNSAMYGGGFANDGGFAVLLNSTVSENYAAGSGGGLANRGSASYAGAMYLGLNSIVGNTAALGGGVYSHNYGSIPLASRTLSRRTQPPLEFKLDGQALRMFDGKLSGEVAQLLESSLSGSLRPSRPLLGGVQAVGNVVSGNVANGASAAGGLIAPSPVASSGNEMHLVNSDYASYYNVFGHDGEDNAAAFYGFTPSGDFTATSDGVTPTPLASIVSTTLADNASSVLAGVPPGAVVQTLALPSGSPAIDFAPETFCSDSALFPFVPPLDTDERGKPRNVDGDGLGSTGSDCDAGAYEFQADAVVPRIIVHKQTLPDGDATPFEFRLRGPVGRDFTLTDNEPHSTGVIPSGIYTLEEILPPGWDPAIPFSALTCDDGSPLSAIDLAADESVVCRFLNYKRGNIIVKKVTIPPVAAPSFSMRLINNTSLQKTFFSLANAQQFDTGAITSVPTYKLLETLPGGWKKKNIVCDNGSPSTAITVPPGGTVTCTVTNENTAPSNISLSNSSVLENKPIGTLVGNLSATDAVAGDTHTFSFVNDGTPAAANNGNFQIVGAQLKTAKKFDFETKSSHNIKLMVTDSAGQTKVKTFVINVLNGPN